MSKKDFVQEARLNQDAEEMRANPGKKAARQSREELEFWAAKPDVPKWRSRRKWALAQLARPDCPKAKTVKPPRPQKAPKPVPPQPLHDGRSEKRPLAYVDYLRTQHWSIVRTKAVNAAGHHCEQCGSGYRLNVHHLTYANLWHEYAADLKVLCETCHAILHGQYIYTGLD